MDVFILAYEFKWTPEVSKGLLISDRRWYVEQLLKVREYEKGEADRIVAMARRR